jgi:hypothetical protein
MDTQRRFVRGIMGLLALAFVFFSLEFLWEWNRLGCPGVSYADYKENAKMVDVLSPMARAYNNILAMLIATVGLAIPLTANMHTPKLIDMFLRDRINQVMLIFGALGAAHVLWVDFLIGPNFAPVWAYRVAVLGAMLGWVVLIPYFFYVVRFLDPSNILGRLKHQVLVVVDRVGAGKDHIDVAHELVRDQVHQIGTLVLKSIDRGDRGVAAEGIWVFKQILDHYRPLKTSMPDAWFRVQRRDLVGLSHEALELLNADRTWFEHQVLWQMYLAYENALAKAQDSISALSDATRIIALHSAAAGDDKALELTVKFFNNFLREGIKKKDTHAVYDLLYQYRQLACELCDHPDVLRRLGKYMRHYAQFALANGVAFVPQFLAFDLGSIVVRAFEHNCPAASSLLDDLLALKHLAGVEPLPLIVKAKAVVGANLLEGGRQAEAERVRANLTDVPQATLGQVERELLTMEDRSFWEVTDRQVNFEWVPPEHRASLQKFFALLRKD